jgi:hypothetical protein
MLVMPVRCLLWPILQVLHLLPECAAVESTSCAVHQHRFMLFTSLGLWPGSDSGCNLAVLLQVFAACQDLRL